MTTITNAEELFTFLDAAFSQGVDPSAVVCQMFVRWGELSPRELTASWSPRERVVLLHIPDEHGSRFFPLGVSMDSPEIVDDVLLRYQMRKICPGVWAMAPSWNVPGELHAYLVFHNVPEPAPWEQLVVLAQAF